MNPIEIIKSLTGAPSVEERLSFHRSLVDKPLVTRVLSSWSRFYNELGVLVASKEGVESFKQVISGELNPKVETAAESFGIPSENSLLTGALQRLEFLERAYEKIDHSSDEWAQYKAEQQALAEAGDAAVDAEFPRKPAPEPENLIDILSQLFTEGSEGDPKEN